MTELQKLLKQNFPDLNFEFDYNLAAHSYYKIGGPAEVFIKLKEKNKIIELIKFCRQNDLKLTILGEASNVLISDEGISGLVLTIANDKISDKKEIIDNKFLLKVGAGVKMSTLVRKSVELGLTGLEYFFSVPGTLGGAVYNNSHYQKFLIGDYIKNVLVIDQKGDLLILEKKDCNFAYDQSRFQKTKEIILEAEFILEVGNEVQSKQLIKESTQYRLETQPLGLPSCGCIFQNVENNDNLRKLFPQFKDKEYISAGFLIDQAGLKGLKIGDVEVSTKHAAFFVNQGTGKASDVIKLIKQVKQQVKDKFGIELKEEVVYLS